MRGASLRTPLARPPILASEALREDLAPIEPAKTPLRIWCACLGLLLFLLGLALRHGLLDGPPDASTHALVVGASTVFAGVLPLPYAVRGAVAVLGGMAIMIAAFFGRGLLMGLVLPGTHWQWEAARAAAAVALPATLLFRARYRAYRGARLALALGIALSVPASIHDALSLVSGTLVVQIAAGLSLAAIAGSFLGFMGSGTTGASTLWAVAVLVTSGLWVMVRSLTPDSPPTLVLAHGYVGLVFLLSASLAVIGWFQLLAAAFARDARRVDVLKTRNSSKRPPSQLDSMAG